MVELAVAAAGRAPLRDVRAGRRGLLHSGVARIRNVDVSGRIGGQVGGIVELPVTASGRAPFEEILGWRLRDRRAGAAELLNAVVGLICDIDVRCSIGGHAGWVIELTVPRAVRAPLR